MSEATSHLAIVLPGRRYGVSGPALLVPTLALQQAGATVEVVRYPEDVAPDDDAGLAAVIVAVDEQIRRVAVQQPWHRVTFVAKSLGTQVLAALSTAVVPPVEVEVIWVTPLFGDPEVRAGALEQGWRSLVVAGGADPLHDPDGHALVVDGLRADALVLPDANHSLEVSGDLHATIDGWRRLADAVLTFARRG